MERSSLPEPDRGLARSLLVLRHALSSPLSTAALKLDVMERRLSAPSGAETPWVVEKLRAAQAEMSAASRRLDLLLRLSEIESERPQVSALDEVCGAAGVALSGSGIALPRLVLRRRASGEAFRGVAAFVSSAGAPSAGRAGFEGARVTLAFEGSRPAASERPDRLFDLPDGTVESESLFAARAAAEADGGRLEITEKAGRLVALFSWPAPAAEGTP